MRRLTCAAVVACCLWAVTAVGAEQRVEMAPGSSTIFTHGTIAFLVFAPGDSSEPVVVAVFIFGGDVRPDPFPTPDRVSAIWIIENQEDRGKLTADQMKVLDDPVWQAAAIVKGLTYRIEDKDHEDAKVFLDIIEILKIPLPAVCLVTGDGNIKPVEVVPLPADVGGMRDLIGGVQ